MAVVAAAVSCLFSPPACTVFPSSHCYLRCNKLTLNNSKNVGGCPCKGLREGGGYVDMGASSRGILQPIAGAGFRNHQVRKKFVAEGGGARRVLYGEAETYVLMEPGEDEQFVTLEELQEKLKTWLEQWPGKELPPDLVQYDSIEDAVEYLVTSVCELELGGGLGSIQWFEVRLDPVRHDTPHHLPKSTEREESKHIVERLGKTQLWHPVS